MNDKIKEKNKFQIFKRKLIFKLFVVSQAVWWPCLNNEDCTATDSYCGPGGLCQCNEFYQVFSGDYTKCLNASLYGDTCEDSNQCNLMPSGASCKSEVCDCVNGHTYVRGRCRPLNGLDQPCNTVIF